MLSEKAVARRAHSRSDICLLKPATNPATIADSGNGLAIFAVGDRIEVAGPSNRGRWTVATAAAGSLTVTPGRIATASAGGSVSIRKVG